MSREHETPLLWMSEDELRQYARQLLHILIAGTPVRIAVPEPEELPVLVIDQLGRQRYSSCTVH